MGFLQKKKKTLKILINTVMFKKEYARKSPQSHVLSCTNFTSKPKSSGLPWALRGTRCLRDHYGSGDRSSRGPVGDGASTPRGGPGCQGRGVEGGVWDGTSGAGCQGRGVRAGRRGQDGAGCPQSPNRTGSSLGSSAPLRRGLRGGHGREQSTSLVYPTLRTPKTV